MSLTMGVGESGVGLYAAVGLDSRSNVVGVVMAVEGCDG